MNDLDNSAIVVFNRRCRDLLVYFLSFFRIVDMFCRKVSSCFYGFHEWTNMVRRSAYVAAMMGDLVARSADDLLFLHPGLSQERLIDTDNLEILDIDDHHGIIQTVQNGFQKYLRSLKFCRSRSYAIFQG